MTIHNALSREPFSYAVYWQGKLVRRADYLTLLQQTLDQSSTQAGACWLSQEDFSPSPLFVEDKEATKKRVAIRRRKSS